MSTTAQLVGPYERLLFFKALSLSNHPPVAALAALAREASERHFEGGTSITDVNTPWNTVNVVVEGHVSVSQSGQALYGAGPREPFGLLEVLARVEGGVDARADVDTATLEIRATTLLSILEDHYILTQATIQALGRALLTTPAWLLSTTSRHVTAASIAPPSDFDLVHRVRQLQASDVFAHARVDSLIEIASQYEEFHETAGTRLWREGDSAGWLLMLLDGTVDNRSSSGLRFSWTAGTVGGAFEAVASAPRWHDAVAATDVTGFRLSAERLYDALEDDFKMAEDLLSMLAARVRSQQMAHLRQSGSMIDAAT